MSNNLTTKFQIWHKCEYPTDKAARVFQKEKKMKQTGIEPATFRLQLFSEKIQDLIGVESSTIEPLLHFIKKFKSAPLLITERCMCFLCISRCWAFNMIIYCFTSMRMSNNKDLCNTSHIIILVKLTKAYQTVAIYDINNCRFSKPSQIFSRTIQGPTY